MTDRERRYRRLFRLPVRTARIERDLDDELRFHLDMRAARTGSRKRRR